MAKAKPIMRFMKTALLRLGKTGERDAPLSSRPSVIEIIDLSPIVDDDGDLIGAAPRSARRPRRPSKLPQNHFQRSLRT